MIHDGYPNDSLLLLLGLAICRYFEQKAGPKAAIRTRNEGDEKFSIHELKLHRVIRIPEHTQDHERYESQEISQPLGLETENSGAHRRGARGHCEDINVGLPRYGNKFGWRLRAGDSLRLKINFDLNLIVISMGARRGRTNSPLSCIRRFPLHQSGRSSLESRIWGVIVRRDGRILSEHKEAGPMKRRFFTRKYDKSQDIRILLEMAHPVRGHKEVGPMNSSPRANATKARTLDGILLDAARVQQVMHQDVSSILRSCAVKFEKAPSRVKSCPEGEGREQAMSHNK
ncbi:hypothetical protein B0H13DRAFT_2525960 [Mycena leptocephala]|nr:hypothetical protein B0H13DRAFT_2525960 [Mycena leptocephala]